MDDTNNTRQVAKISISRFRLTHIVSGYEIALQFTDLDIADSDNCTGDYVEVRKGNSTGEIIGVYCGDQVPRVMKNKGDLWVLFESKSFDGTASSKGFLAEFSYCMSSSRQWRNFMQNLFFSQGNRAVRNFRSNCLAFIPAL